MTTTAQASAVLPASELSRIVSSVESVPSSSGPKAASLALHQASSQRASRWTNTLEGQRKAAEKEREAALAAAEAARQALDVAEAEIQRNERRQVIERANALLAQESDRVKAFGSAMLQSDVLKEREQQVLVKAELEQLERIRTQRYADLNHANYRKLLERELREKHSEEAKAQQVAEEQKNQLRQAKIKRLQEIDEAEMEGKLLRKKAEEELLIELERSIKKKVIAVNNLKQTQKATAYLREVKAREITRSIQEDERIQKYAEQKEAMTQLRKLKEKELFDKKQAARTAMIEKQQAELMARMNKEDERVARQVQQRDEQLERENQAKLDKMHKWQMEINQSRQSQIAQKASLAESHRLQEAQSAAQVRELAKRLEKDEQDEINERKSAYRRIAMEQLNQVALKHKYKADELAAEREVVSHAKNALMADMLDFHRYAEGIIKNYALDGKNVIPLIKQLREYKNGLAC